MAVRNQKQLQIEQERANGRAVRRMGKGFAGDIAPLLAAIRGAKSEAGLRRALGPTLLRRMGTDAMGEALGLEGLKAAASGMASARPREMADGD